MNAPTAADDPTQLPRRTKALAMLGALLGMLLAALDQTIVATAGPTIQRELAIEPSLYTWITTAYLVASTVLVPIWGKLSDAYGRRRVLLVGIGIFLTGSVLCGLSGTTTQLIVARAVQGVGSASLFTSAFAVVADLFAPAERGRVQGIFGSVFGLSSVVGPLLGGFITDNFGWHWCFLVNVPVGAIAVAVIALRMPALRRPPTGPVRLDFAGAGALALFAVPLLLGLSLGRLAVRPGEAGWPWLSWQIGALFLCAAVGLVTFLVVEGRVRDPLVDLKLFSIRPVAIGLVATFLSGMSFLGAIVFLPLFMVNVTGASATSSGLTTLPLTFGLVVANVSTGQLASRFGRTKPFILGSLAVALAMFAFMGVTLDASSTSFDVAWRMFILGAGLGPSILLFTLTIQNAAPPQVVGVVTSMSTFFRQMGATMGLAALGTVFAAALSLGGGVGPPLGEGAATAGPDGAAAAATVFRVAFADAVARVFLVAAGMQAAALLVALLLPDEPLRGRAPPPKSDG